MARPTKQLTERPLDGCSPVFLRPTLGEDLSLDEVDVHRRTDCTRYDDALDAVVARGWPSFSCATCPYYEPVDYRVLLEEAAAARKLLSIVC